MNWCFWTVVLKKTLESPLDCKEIKPVNPKENQSWIFIGNTDAKAETAILWPPDTKNWLLGKDPNTRKDWRWEKMGMTENEMFGWYHWLDGHEFEQALGVSDGQGSLGCCSPWDHKELDTTEWLNWTELKQMNCNNWIHGKSVHTPEATQMWKSWSGPLHNPNQREARPHWGVNDIPLRRITPREINQGALSGYTSS